jgi:hypothetical protein
MSDVVVYPFQGSVAVSYPAAGIPIQFIIDNVVPPDSPYAVIDSADVPSQEGGYRGAWQYDFETPGAVLTVDLPISKNLFQGGKNVAATREVQSLSPYYLEAVASGNPTGTITDAINAITTARDSVDYLAASTVTDLTKFWPAVLGTNPFITPTTGSISVGRGAVGNPEDINNSWLVTWNSLIPPEDTELYIPGTGITIDFSGTVGVPPNYVYSGSCYDPGDYLTQLRQASTGFVLFEFVCPLAGVENQVLEFPSVAPFPAFATGVINIGRGQFGGPLDLNESTYVMFNSPYSLTQSETELYVPGTGITLAYGALSPGGFNSAGPCFNTGDYLIQIRVAETNIVIAEFEVPLSTDGSNEDITF